MRPISCGSAGFVARFTVLEVLHPLVSNTRIVREMMSKGATVYLLDMFCNSTNAQVREKTAEVLAKMMSEKLTGPKLRLQLAKFLPIIFMDAMRDSPEISVHMFEGKHCANVIAPQITLFDIGVPFYNPYRAACSDLVAECVTSGPAPRYANDTFLPLSLRYQCPALSTVFRPNTIQRERPPCLPRDVMDFNPSRLSNDTSRILRFVENFVLDSSKNSNG